METVEVTRNLWQSWGVTVGSLVSAAVVLTILAKVPGGRQAFKFLVADPVGRWNDARMDAKIKAAGDAQAEAIRVAIETHVRECLEPIAAEISQINNAINNVGPGIDPMKTRVGNIEHGQAEANGKLDTVIEMVTSLIGRS